MLLNLGAELEITFEREIIGFTLRVNKNKTNEAIAILS